jgi:hypothetical protein
MWKVRTTNAELNDDGACGESKIVRENQRCVS